MAWSVNDSEVDVSDRKFASIFEHHVIVVLNEGVLPVRRTFVGNVNLCPDFFGQLAATSDVVSVNMSFGCGNNLHTFAVGGFEVMVNTSIGVDQDRFTRFLASHHVGSMCQCFVVKVLK